MEQPRPDRASQLRALMEVGLSSRVKEQLGKIGIHPSIKQRIAEHLEKKGG
jgi:hypothetical protein